MAAISQSIVCAINGFNGFSLSRYVFIMGGSAGRNRRTELVSLAAAFAVAQKHHQNTRGYQPECCFNPYVHHLCRSPFFNLTTDLQTGASSGISV